MPVPGYMYGPLYLYFNVTGTTEPGISDTSLSGWTPLTNPNKTAYTEEGVTIATTDTTEDVFTTGSTAPQDVRLTQRKITISGAIMDVRAEALAIVLGDFGTTAIATGTKTAAFNPTSRRSERALLVRGQESPHNTTKLAQLYAARVANVQGEISMVYVKGQPAMLQFSFLCLEHTDGTTAHMKYGT